MISKFDRIFTDSLKEMTNHEMLYENDDDLIELIEPDTFYDDEGDEKDMYFYDTDDSEDNEDEEDVKKDDTEERVSVFIGTQQSDNTEDDDTMDDAEVPEIHTTADLERVFDIREPIKEENEDDENEELIDLVNIATTTGGLYKGETRYEDDMPEMENIFPTGDITKEINSLSDSNLVSDFFDTGDVDELIDTVRGKSSSKDYITDDDFI